MMQRALLVLALAGGAVAHTTITPLSDLFWIYIGICAGLTLVAGLMSGLTLGLLGMDLLYLEVLSKGGEPNTQKYATRIMGLVKRRHWVLVTLLLANSAAMEALPLFLDRLVHPAIAVVISVTVVLMFGEIIPQSVCSKWGLAIGYYTTWFVWILLVLFAPLAWPISKILDLVLGEHGATFYRRSELKELVIAHSRPDRSDMGAPDVEERLSEAQSALISGAIDANEKTIGDCYRPLKETYKLNVRTLLTNDILHEMVAQGHSRIPIWSGRPENLVGLLRVKMLIVQDNLAGRYLRELPLSPLPRVPPTRPLYDMLKDFQTGKSHMVCVEDPVTHDALGIATLEDVIEEILLTEIDQEKDANYTLPPMWITSRGSVYIPKNSQPKVKTPLRRAASHYPTSSTSKSPIAHSNISDTLTLARSPLGHPSPMPSLPTDDRNPLGRSTAAVPSPRPLWRSSSSVVLTAKDEDRFSDKSFMKTSNASVETSPLLPRSDRSIQ